MPDAADGDLLWATVTDDTGNVVTAAPQEISLEPTPQAPTTTTLESTRTFQRYAAATQDRALLLVEVSGDAALADPTGSVRVTAGDRTLATAPVTDGTARWRLPATLAPGSYALRARFVPDDPAVAESVSAPVRVVVQRAVATATTSLANGGRSLAVAVRAAGVTPTGTVRVRVTGPRNRTFTGRLRGGRVVVPLGTLPRGSLPRGATYRRLPPGRTGPSPAADGPALTSR